MHHRTGCNESIANFCDIPIEDAGTTPDYRDTSDEPKLTDILQNNWPVICKCLSHKSPTKTEKLFQTEKLKYDKVTHHSEQDTFALKDIIGTFDEQRLRTGW